MADPKTDPKAAEKKAPTPPKADVKVATKPGALKKVDTTAPKACPACKSDRIRRMHNRMIRHGEGLEDYHRADCWTCDACGEVAKEIRKVRDQKGDKAG